MPATERDSPRERGALAFAALALALLAVTGLASSVSPWRANGAAASAPTIALQGVAVAGGVVLAVALVLLWVETPTTRRLKPKKRAPAGDELDELGTSLSTAGRTAAVMLLGLAILCIATLPLLVPSTSSQSDAGASPPSAEDPSPPTARGRPAEMVDLGWLVLPIAATLAVLTPVALVVRRRRRKWGEAGQADDAGTFGRALRASITALESERDPRTAILRAYARMEQAFRDVEIIRARDETASEFMARTTRRLPVSADAAEALTERFEEVRFSEHEITEADREQALASLHQVERELTERS